MPPPVLAIGVCVPRGFEDAGEFLADARALEAAGVDALWLDGDEHDPWLLLAGIAAVSGRVKLVARIAEGDPGAVEARVSTLGRLSRGRLVIEADGRAEDVVAVVALARRCGCRVLIGAAAGPLVEAGALAADGVVGPGEAPDVVGAAVKAVREARAAAGSPPAFEIWARVPVPADRAGWRETRDAYAAAGATGLILRADPRLLDLLRNGDEEDDRSDLTLSQG